MLSNLVRSLIAVGELLACAFGLQVAVAAEMDRFRERREKTSCERAPTVQRDGDRVRIAFTTASLCDVTVAIEDSSGTIVRHLASGVLGGNASEPFQKNSRAQKLVWDGKDDTGT